MENTNQDTHFSVTMVKVLYQWKWHIITATVLTLIAGIIFSSPIFMTPKYTSELIMYPPHTLTTKTLVLHEPRFGSDLDADQHIQLLTSGIVVDSIVNKYKLIEHYKINTKRDRWQERLSKKYQSNINIRRTKFNSIRISVRDHVPQIAADIAWSIAETGDAFREHIFKKNMMSTYMGIKNEYEKQEKIVSDLFETLENKRVEHFETAFEIIEDQKNRKVNSINQIHKNIDDVRNKYGIYDLGEQINLLYEQLVTAQSNFLRDSARMNMISEFYNPKDTVYINLKARLEGSRSQYKELNKRLSELTKSNAAYAGLLTKFQIESATLADVQTDFDEYERSYHKVIPNLDFFRNRKLLETEFDILLDLRRELFKAENNFNQDFLKSYIVQTPGVSSIPSHPKKAIIIILPTILMFFSSCFLALFISVYIPKLKKALNK